MTWAEIDELRLAKDLISEERKSETTFTQHNKEFSDVSESTQHTSLII